MSETTKYAIMLKIESGSSERLPFSLDSLKSDLVVAVIDEVHKVIWLWTGANTGLVQRRSAMRVAQSLKTYGHSIGPTIVGRNLDDVLAVDERKIETDSLMKGRYGKITQLFQMEYNIEADVLAVFKSIGTDAQPSYYGLSREQRDNLVQAAIESHSAGDDEREIEEIVGQYRPPPEKSEQEMVEVSTVDDALLGDIKASIVISSVLTEINDLFISVNKSDGHNEYIIENADGVVCKFIVEGSNIKFKSGSWDIVDKNTKTKIQKVFIDRTKKLLGNL
ncbi:MAG: hypothetical protein GF329_12805 [Candidatus Lokiarchaeota archaeon]|nr:hypothetical protein [Candidatus Lokiarchaeota archaeon]